MNTSLELSFKARLRNIAQEKRIDPAQLWQILVLERFLVRLSKSKHAHHFILKGGILLTHYVKINRHTQDLDFLIRNLNNQVDALEKILEDIIKMPLNDGFTFTDLKIANLSHIHMKYPGLRASIRTFFGKTRFQVNIDLGFGDLSLQL